MSFHILILITKGEHSLTPSQGELGMDTILFHFLGVKDRHRLTFPCMHTLCPLLTLWVLHKKNGQFKQVLEITLLFYIADSQSISATMLVWVVFVKLLSWIVIHASLCKIICQKDCCGNIFHWDKYNLTQTRDNREIQHFLCVLVS